MTLINIGYLSSQIQQFKLRRNLKKMQTSIDVNVDVTQQLTKMSYTKFNSLSFKFSWGKSIKNGNIYYINRPAFK